MGTIQKSSSTEAAIAYLSTDELVIKGAPLVTEKREGLFVGNPATFTELQKLLKEHGKSQEPLRTVVPWESVKMPVVTRTIKGLHLNNDQHADFLVLRSFEIYTESSRHQTVSFLVEIHGNDQSDALGAPTVEMLKSGAVLATGTLPGSKHPITNIEITPTGDKHVVRYALFTSGPKELTTGAHSLERSYRKDRALYEAVSGIQAYLQNGIGYGWILQGAEFSKGTPAVEALTKSSTLMYHRLSAPFMRLSDRYDAIVTDPKLVAFYTEKDPDLLPFMKAISIAAKKELLLTKEESDKVTELSTESGELMQGALGKFRWKGKTITRNQFYQTLRETKSPLERRELVEGYSQVVLSAHKEGLFPMIAELNKIARRHGFENYAEYVGPVKFGISPTEFETLSKEFHASNKERLERFIEELRAVGGGGAVHEWDVQYLADTLVRQKLGGKDVPKLTFKDAFKAAGEFLKDVGMDLEAAPFDGKIFYDTNKREDKYGNAFAVTIGDGTKVWFNTNFDTTEEISLEDLGTVVHELVHDIHMLQSAQRARGSVAMGIEGNPNTWTESIAVAVDRLVVTQEWMDKYLSHLPQFSDPQVRQSIAEVYDNLATYEQMMILSRARFEISLYQDKNLDGTARSIEDRQNFWPAWVRKYMHVDAMEGTKGGRVYATPHFADSPGYYVSYQGGFGTAIRATKPIYKGLETGNEKLMKEGGARLLHLFGLGARLTSIAEIEAEIDRMKK